MPGEAQFPGVGPPLSCQKTYAGLTHPKTRCEVLTSVVRISHLFIISYGGADDRD